MEYNYITNAIKYTILLILYQRGLYDEDFFLFHQWEDFDVLEIFEPDAEEYITKTVQAIKSYLKAQRWIKVVLCIYNSSFRTVEKWEFVVSETSGEDSGHHRVFQVYNLLRAVEDTSKVIPRLDQSHTFKIMLYIDPDIERLNTLEPCQNYYYSADYVKQLHPLTGNYNMQVSVGSNKPS